MVTPVEMMGTGINQYRQWVGDKFIDEITELASPLRNSRILHLCATPSRLSSGGILSALISLMQELGISAEGYRVPVATAQQRSVNKAINRALDGCYVQFTPSMHDTWLHSKDAVYDVALEDYDCIVVHDVELAGIINGRLASRKDGKTRWIWHCHSDLSKAQPDIWDFLLLHTLSYDRRLVSCLRQGVEAFHESYDALPPAIDPLNIRNRDLPKPFVSSLMKQHGINSTHPFVMLILSSTQLLGIPSNIIDGFCLAKEQVPELQLLVLVSGDMQDQQLLHHATHLNHKLGNRDVQLIHMDNGIGNMEISAFKQAAVAVLEVSHDGETTTDLLETMWKGRPLIVGERTAARLGIVDDFNGSIAHSALEYGSKIVRFTTSPGIVTSIGRAAKEHVRERFLITSLLRTYLTMLDEVEDHSEANKR